MSDLSSFQTYMLDEFKKIESIQAVFIGSDFGSSLKTSLPALSIEYLGMKKDDTLSQGYVMIQSWDLILYFRSNNSVHRNEVLRDSSLYISSIINSLRVIENIGDHRSVEIESIGPPVAADSVSRVVIRVTNKIYL
jgi:hypothetical protein